MADSIARRAPGKLNLTLDVLGKRPDGFHELQSLMIGVGLCDDLRIEDAAPGVVELACASPEVPVDGSNLVCRAARLLGERTRATRGCCIRLEKRVPIGGGMGGGSSDAAATLAALNELWACGLAANDLAAMGAELGSDVPFFFALPSAAVSGRGEMVVPLALRWSGWAVLVFAGGLVSTREVYARWRSPAGCGRRVPWDVLAKCATAAELGPGLRNDLEEAVFEVAPHVGEMHDWLRSVGAEHVRVSGAGSVLFNLFDEEHAAGRFVDKLRSLRPGIEATVARAPVAA